MVLFFATAKINVFSQLTPGEKRLRENLRCWVEGASREDGCFMACFHCFWVFFFDFGLEHFWVRVRCKFAVSPIGIRCEGVEVWRLCVWSCSYLTHWVSLCQSTLFCLAKTVQKYDRGIAVYEWKRNFFSFFLQNTNCHLISHYTFRCGTVHCPKSTPNQCLFLILTNGLMFCLWSGCPVFLLVILTFSWHRWQRSWKGWQPYIIITVKIRK